MPTALTIAAASTTTDPTLVREGLGLLFLLAILAALLVPGLALILVLRRHYLGQPRRRKTNASPTADAWSEAGRRATLPDDPEEEQPGLGAPGG